MPQDHKRLYIVYIETGFGTSQLDGGFWMDDGTRRILDSAPPRRLSGGFNRPFKIHCLTNTSLKVISSSFWSQKWRSCLLGMHKMNLPQTVAYHRPVYCARLSVRTTSNCTEYKAS